MIMTNGYIYFVANWKMYGDVSSLKSLKNVIKLSKHKNYKKTKIIYCPPFTLLDSFRRKTLNSKIYLGAQDCFKIHGYGSYTGSISAKILKSCGVKYVLIGHSEKRVDGDTNDTIKEKINSANKENIKIILCVGESLRQKKNNQTKNFIKKQILNSVKSKKDLKNIIIAYEPIWSIGSGVIPKNDEIENIVRYIKLIIKKKFRVENISVLYGGSVNPQNIDVLKKIKNINGFLIGGASQRSNKFIDIVKKSIM